MVLLGYEVETGLAGGRHAWITYHWYAGPLSGHDYTVVDRITFGDHGTWQNNHRPTYGVHPTSTWREGQVVKESFLVDLPADPLSVGGDYCRGDLVPAKLWIAVSERDAEGNSIGGLVPFRPSGAEPHGRVRGPTGIESTDGRLWSNDALFQVGGFWVPVPPGARVPDDGRPLSALRRFPPLGRGPCTRGQRGGAPVARPQRRAEPHGLHAEAGEDRAVRRPVRASARGFALGRGHAPA
jgi:hypothetical protein